MKLDLPLMIALPYAGGSAYAYKAFEPYIGESVRMICPELPGRASRLLEPFLLSANAMTEDLFDHCHSLFQKPYILFGHSMGALLGYLLAKKALQNGYPPPRHLLLTGRGAPSVPPRKAPRYPLPKKEFYATLKELGGIQDDMLNNTAYMSFFEPLLRADFQVVETYTHAASTLLPIPITLVTGEDEDILPEEIAAWQEESQYPIHRFSLPGNHFFLFDHPKEFGNIIHRIINHPFHERENDVFETQRRY
ncbi:MAG TPA: alpha/beta fold hydrolase [Puia sp.]|uniref:thioesterase II family protein n=1 Tax=Puia sp. TaxID=2045100 RepID=UPI002BE27100|nr:alpha/beta fold hydrolase [Puia sp.]HVU94507.1 alpha/beta fold hydrolase [Puia sp.]